MDDDGVVLVEWSMPDGTVVRSVFGCGWWQPRLDGVEADTEASGIAGHERI